jgi:hypothetical protein
MRAKLLAAVGHLPEGSSGAAKETPALAFFLFCSLEKKMELLHRVRKLHG